MNISRMSTIFVSLKLSGFPSNSYLWISHLLIFYVSINCHMIGLWYFILPLMWGHLWWLFFIINFISLKITQILRDGHSWVYLLWHFQGRFSSMSCELVNESSLGGFIIPLSGGDGRHEAGLIGGVGTYDISLGLYFVLFSSASPSLLSVYREGKRSFCPHS